MKRIIALVFLGLLVYAGGFIIYYAALDLKINNSAPMRLEDIQPQSIYNGLTAEGSVYQVIEEIYTKEYQPKLLGLPFGKATIQHYYVLPFGASDRFMLIAAYDEQDIEILNRLKTDSPRERGENDPVLEVRGIIEETAPLENQKLKEYLLYESPELIGYWHDYPYRLESVADKHAIRYTLYIKHPSGADYIPLYIGIGMCVVGIGLAVVLILRIKSERDGGY